MIATAILCAISVIGGSGLVTLLFPRTTDTGQRIAVMLHVLAAGAATAAAVMTFWHSTAYGIALPWQVPGGALDILVDPLAAVFLLPVLIGSALGAIYGLGYWRQSEHPESGRRVCILYGLLAAAMATVVVARNAILFLAGWEIMTLSAFFLVATEDEKREVRRASWIYWVAAHAGILFLFAFFAVYKATTGTFSLQMWTADAVGQAEADRLFLLALAAFGFKAGVFPLHFWLPPAHAAAPSHVSAILSGVLLKLGIYGLVRFLWIVPNPSLWWGELVLILGAVSAVVGVAFALGQHDVKRLLAYHSIENIGIILLGLGLAVMGKSTGNATWMTLGLGGALLHVWNHGLFKGLLFLAAGAVVHATHTREIDHLGGLSKSMPITAACFLVGAVAICGLPPMNGFVSEWCIYLGLFESYRQSHGSAGVLAAAATVVLGLIGALALACFVKVYGAVFLGEPRSDHGRGAVEAPPVMLAPQIVLALLCLLIGSVPWIVEPMLNAANRCWAGTGPGSVSVGAVGDLMPMSWLSVTALAVLLGAGAGYYLVYGRQRPDVHKTPIPTWDCGYARPAATMQYTASSLAQMLIGSLHWLLLPVRRVHGVSDSFPVPNRFHSVVPDVILDRVLIPGYHRFSRFASWTRHLQVGLVQAYILYIFLTLLALLIWS